VAHSPSSRCDAPTGAADCTNPDEKAMIDVSELVGVASQRTGEAPSENPLIAGFLSGVRMMIALRVLPALSGVYNRLQRQPRFCDPHRPRWIIRCSAKASARSALPALPTVRSRPSVTASMTAIYSCKQERRMCYENQWLGEHHCTVIAP
jgi:hypothetical protein